jgi:hypothetical protein
LTGWELVGIDGNGGKPYNALKLVGKIPTDGYFVVANTTAAAWVADQADQKSTLADHQNGPDSVELRYGSKVIDAVGYGTFGAGETFAGEGKPAPDPISGSSIGRDANASDSNDNRNDFKEFSTQTPGAANVVPNKPPVAKLACPGTAKVGESVSLDASGSSDPDGKIQSYLFDFGDGSAKVAGANPDVEHAFAKAGSFKGATGQTTCSVAGSGANPPSVQIVKPSGNFNATQGETVAFTVDATAKPGKSIASATLLIDGQPVGTDTTAPHTFTYTVPANAKTGSKMQVTASATDSAGSVGSAQPLVLTVVNDVPLASFAAIVTGALKVGVDAGLSSDTETPAADLEVRWDWENDGAWDTAFDKAKTGTHTYAKEGTFTIKMEVKDGAGQTATTTRTVNLSLLQQVAGTVNTTTWAGTIVVTGDVLVPNGQVLTVGAGTSVQVANIDANKDGKGDDKITVEGKLVVKGTKDEPVVFTSYGTPPPAGKGWVGLILKGQGSTVDYAVIEYADVGIDVRDTSTVSNTTLHKNGTGLLVTGAGKLTSQGNKVTANVGNGVLAQGGMWTSTGDKFTQNGKSGAALEGSGAAATANVTALTASVSKSTSSSSYSASTSIPAIYHRKPKGTTELGAFTMAGMVNCKGNYWGTFPDVAPLFALNRTNAVDYQGLKIGAISGTGPQKQVSQVLQAFQDRGAKYLTLHGFCDMVEVLKERFHEH